MSDALAKIQRFREDFPLYAQACLKILDKEGKLIPFVFNTPQQILHAAVEKQKADKGWVRVLVLKARKQGVSTYVQGRNYHRTTLWKHQHSYILTHEQPATEVIFEIVERYQKSNPLAPIVGTSNAKELSFAKLESSYTVATAGTKAGGRGGTPRFFHGSEVAFWPNAKDHFKGSVNAVPDAPGTEIILESTANGTSGEFYDRWQDAIAGRGDYIAVFIPWYASPEYAREPDEFFELNAESEDGELSEVEVAEMFGLSLAQMCWRRAKILAVGGANAFRQEYPATAEEAFVSADRSTYIDALSVLRARKRKNVVAGGPLILGIDPAGSGGDRFSIAFRRGYVVEKVIYRDKVETQAALAWIRSVIDDHAPDRVFIDSGGLGAPITSMLKGIDPNYAKIITGVNFGSKSQAKNARPGVAGPKNRRAEMWMRSREWLRQEDPVSIPDDDALQADATGPWVLNDINNDLLLSSKEQMKAKGIRSPDLWDSVVLTFAESVWVEPGKARLRPAVTGDTRPQERGQAPSFGHSMPPFKGHRSPTSWMG